MGQYNLVAYLAIQFKEISEHKWYLSQQYNREVCFEETMVDWNKSNAKRFHDTFFEHLDKINQVCEEHCGGQCNGLENCVLSNNEIHELLED